MPLHPSLYDVSSSSQTIVIMRGLVLLLSAAAALCGAAPAPPLEPVTCGGDQQETNAARFAMQHINEKQNHGYKFKLAEVTSSKVEQVSGYNPLTCLEEK